MSDVPDEENPNAEVRYDDNGLPLYPRMRPGGLEPKQRPKVYLTKRSDYARGSSQDIRGNRN